MTATYDIKARGERMKLLNDDEIGCVTCSRYRTGSPLCDWCVRWNKWQGVEQVNDKLVEKGFTAYDSATEMRIDNIYSPAKALRYRYKRRRAKIEYNN